MRGGSNQNIGNFEAQGQPPYQQPPYQQQYQQPPPQYPGYGPPPGAPPGPPMAPMAPAGRPAGVTILAVLYFIQGIMMLLVPILISVCLVSMFSVPGVEEEAGGDIFAAGAICWIVFGILALIYFLIGFGLLKGQNWARIVAIIFAIIGLLNVPIGTIISIIILWYLFKPEIKAYFT